MVKSTFILIIFQAFVHKSVMEELKRIIDDSEIMHEDDALWPPPDRVGRQVCNKLLVPYLSLTLVMLNKLRYQAHF